MKTEANGSTNTVSEKVVSSIKQEIMNDVMGGIFGSLQRHKEELTTSQSILDILFSVLVMTNREVLSRIIFTSKAQLHTKKILKDFFENVNDEVKRRLHEEIGKIENAH